MGGDSWTVGPIYLRNLFYAVRQIKEREIGLSLLTPTTKRDTQDYARSLEVNEIIQDRSPRQWTPLCYGKSIRKTGCNCRIWF